MVLFLSTLLDARLMWIPLSKSDRLQFFMVTLLNHMFLMPVEPGAKLPIMGLRLQSRVIPDAPISRPSRAQGPVLKSELFRVRLWVRRSPH